SRPRSEVDVDTDTADRQQSHLCERCTGCKNRCNERFLPCFLHKPPHEGYKVCWICQRKFRASDVDHVLHPQLARSPNTCQVLGRACCVGATPSMWPRVGPTYPRYPTLARGASRLQFRAA